MFRLKRKNYSEALVQSRELVARLRNMSRSLDDFVLRCRENIARITADEYERIVGQFRNLMADEQRELEEIQKNASREADAVRSALDHGADTEEARKNLKALNEISKNLDLTIAEQRSLINAKSSVSESYKQILRDSFAIKSFERMDFHRDIMVKLRRMGDGLGDAALNLLLPLVRPDFEKKFSMENFYASYGTISDSEKDPGLDIGNEDELIERRNRERNGLYMEICSSFFAFLQGKTSFRIRKYIRSLSMDELLKWSRDGLLPNTLMTIYQKRVIDIEQIRNTEGVIVAEPLGELDLLWVMANLPGIYLDMKRIVFTTSDETFKYTVTDGEAGAEIEMTDFLVEVEV